MPPLPPTSTLFPYTTLFRSHGEASESKRVTEAATPPSPAQSAGLAGPGHARHIAEAHPRAARRLDRAMYSTCQDRKSTRLNSSHLVISYAVFCLKKKNNVFT